MTARKISGIKAIEGIDVLVAGGGPAGFCAAVEAARSGAKTLLVEQTGNLGGMASSGLVPGWCGFHNGIEYIHAGLAKEVRDGLRIYAGLPPSDDLKDQGGIDAEAMKSVTDSIATKSGIELLFFTTLCGVEMGKDGVVKEAIVANKDGLFAINAKLFIDGTGDADLCHFAGVKTEKGDKDGDMQPVSLCMLMGGLQDDLMNGTPENFRDLMIKDPEFPLIKDDFFYPGLRMNSGHLWGVDGSSVKSVTKAMIDGRIEARQFQDAFRKYIPRAKGAQLYQTASLLGVRETRRIQGECCLILDDYMQRRRFKDEISHNCFFIDIHPSLANRQREAKGEWSWHKEKVDSSYAKGEFHGIPYRCLIPQGVKNLLDAGRSVSADREVQSAIRVMPPCMSMGQAAGAAASLLLASGGKDFREVDTDALRARLKEHGAFIPDVP